jgi:DNA-binding response OmpR family regulator
MISSWKPSKAGNFMTTQHVMVVDDHPMWCEAVATTLVENGYEVITAADGEAAVRIAPASKPNIVLMDLQLPGLSGVETIQQLLALNPEIRILVLSASGEDSDVLAAGKPAQMAT